MDLSIYIFLLLSILSNLGCFIYLILTILCHRHILIFILNKLPSCICHIKCVVNNHFFGIFVGFIDYNFCIEFDSPMLSILFIFINIYIFFMKLWISYHFVLDSKNQNLLSVLWYSHLSLHYKALNPCEVLSFRP